MIQGLQIAIGGEELRRLIGGRIQAHQEKLDALNARLEEREDDTPFNVRPEDGYL